jgi:hypothetical protein
MYAIDYRTVSGVNGPLVILDNVKVSSTQLDDTSDTNQPTAFDTTSSPSSQRLFN